MGKRKNKLLVSPAITYRKIKYTVTPPVTQKAQNKKFHQATANRRVSRRYDYYAVIYNA